MKLMTFIILSFLAFFTSCDKGDSADDNNAPPANLEVTANVSTDNSGNVAFAATASNAVSYDYDFGNGIYQTVPSGNVTYKYPSGGSYNVKVTAKSSAGLTLSKSLLVNVTVTQSLIWSDEFDAPGAPDPAKWGYDLGDGCPNNCGWGNNELEYYTNRPENVTVSGGTLKIKAIKENFSGKPYTSAKLTTKDKFVFKYGKVEARAKLPSGVGTWPAIWSLGNNISTVGWPACGEIDIMEHRGSELNKIFGTLHYPGRSGGNADGGTRVIENASSEFHVYSLDWTPAFIRMYVDGALVHSVANSNSIPFNHDFYLILNLAMGGTFAGAVDPSVTNATLEIDYVRVYQ
jgi:hypothetical protein